MIRTCSKWILAGEHTVTRGGHAIAFPYPNFYLQLESAPSERFVIISDKFKNSRKLARLVERSIRRSIHAQLTISSTIPPSCGFGSSAALSVALAKWTVLNGYFDDVPRLALFLDNIFHKNSSGVDVNVILHEKPILYSRSTGINFLEIDWHPNVVIREVESKASTRECVIKVNDFIKHNAHAGALIDSMMDDAVRLCLTAIKNKDTSTLADGVNLANECFEKWELYTEEMYQMSQLLKKEGALAVKPIGGGCGGGMLAIFPDAA